MNTIVHFKNFVNEINESNGRLYKQSVLKKYKDDAVVQRYLKIAFDPFMVFGISTKKLSKIVPGSGVTEVQSVFDLFEYLEKHNTGTDRDISICQEMLSHVNTWDREAGAILEALICKDLSIGCDSKSINKEIPGLIPTFNVQLANRYFDVKDTVEGKYFAITEKIDGGRIIAIKEHGQVSFYTRAGQKYEGLVDLEKEMLETYPDGTVLDGEITILNNKGVKSKDAYKAARITRSDEPEKHGLKMKCFDAMYIDEWKSQNCTHDYIERRMRLDGLSSAHPHTYFEVLPILYKGTDTSKITELLDEMVAQGSEGIMINLCNAKYEFKRTNALLKCKKFSDADLEIIGFEEGTGRLTGTLGAILVRYKKGNVVKVGSGFTDEMRAEIWADTSKYLNRICTVKYFEETTNKDNGISLRFPTFVSIRTDKFEADF